jgi:hypothetical protein
MKARVAECRLRFALTAVVALASLVAAPVYSDNFTRLVPVEPDFGVSEPLGGFFKTTFEKSLFTRKNWLIRYYRADTPVNATIAFSIYLKGQAFWVNVSHATPEMDPLIREAAEKDRFDVSSVLGQVNLKFFDFPISKSTATALSDVWRRLLSEVTPDPSLRNRVFSDGPVVILFAKNGSNHILSGKVPPSAEQDAKFRQVEEVLTDLMKACTASKAERSKIYRDIELRSQAISETLREEQNDQDHNPSTTAQAQPERIQEFLEAEWLKQKVSHRPEAPHDDGKPKR